MAEFARISKPHGSDRLRHGPFYTVINRTSRVLHITVDGEQFPMQPGVNLNVPSAVAQYAAAQHPRLGTFDKTIMQGETLLVVRELCQDPRLMSIIPPGQEHRGVEQIDRVAHPHDRPVRLEKLARTANREDVPFGTERPGTIDLMGDPFSNGLPPPAR